MAHIGKTLKNFFPIQVNILREEEPIPFSIYVHLPINKRIIRFKKENALIEQGFAKRYSGRGLKSFYVPNSQRKIYEDYLRDHLSKNETKAPLGSEHPSPSTQKESAPQLSTKASSQVEVTPAVDEKIKEAIKGLASPEEDAREQAVKECQKIAKEVVMLSENPKSIFSELWNTSENHETCEHSINVSTFAVLFALGLGYKDRDLLKDMAYAGLLHDLGLASINSKILRTPFTQHNETEQIYFQSHIQTTQNILRQLKLPLNERVQRLIQQHHEKFDGSGYPKRLRNWEIDELSQVFSMADIFEDMLHAHYDGIKRTITDAFSMISTLEKSKLFPQYYNPDLFKKLVAWIESSTHETIVDNANAIVNETVTHQVEAA